MGAVSDLQGVLGLATEGLRFRSGRFGALAVALIWTTGAAGARAQHATDSAAGLAADAFGVTVGLDSVGIYTETDVRGFNPQKAGNARIDDVYFDQLATLSPRLKASQVVRVGITATGEPSPAPSGIISYSARSAGDRFRSTLAFSRVQYGGVVLELDSEIPIVRNHVSLAAGASTVWPRFPDGSRSRNHVYALAPRLRFGGADIKPFASGFLFRQAQTRPLITTSGPFLPPVPTHRRYLGQTWATNRINNFNNGVVAHVELSPRIDFRGGFVQSRIDRQRNYTEIFTQRDASGLASHRLLADPPQDSYANSWNLYLAYKFGDGDLRQSLHVDVRDRRRHIESGGAQPFDFGVVQLGDLDPEPKPSFSFGAVNVGSLHQLTYSIGYRAALDDLAQVKLGVARSRYDAKTRGPLGRSSSSADPWLYNASLVVRPKPRLTLYAGYVSGLEDTGTAPENAVNRNQQLPASRTSQVDAGVQWTVGRMRLVATAFEMKKPYFSFDSAGRYVELADLRHRGVELSAAGDLTERLHVLAGAVLMDPVVTGPARDAGLVGPRPVGTPQVHARLDATLRTDLFDGVKLTLGVQHDSRRAASAVGYAALGGRQLFTPAHTTVDIGVRQNLRVGGQTVSARLVVKNVFNQRAWVVLASNTFQPDEMRRVCLYLMTDF